MTLLLDTHVLMWWLIEPSRLSGLAKGAIERADQVWVSAASIYEIDIKRQDDRFRGRDNILINMPNDMPQTLPSLGLLLLEITPQDAWQAGRLPLHHRDPWDRILVAQARRLGASLVSRDQMLSAYDVEIVW